MPCVMPWVWGEAGTSASRCRATAGHLGGCCSRAVFGRWTRAWTAASIAECGSRPTPRQSGVVARSTAGTRIYARGYGLGIATRHCRVNRDFCCSQSRSTTARGTSRGTRHPRSWFVRWRCRGVGQAADTTRSSSACWPRVTTRAIVFGTRSRSITSCRNLWATHRGCGRPSSRFFEARAGCRPWLPLVSRPSSSSSDWRCGAFLCLGR